MSYRAEIERLRRRLAHLQEVTMTSQEKEASKRNKFQNQRKMLIESFEAIRRDIRDRDQLLEQSHGTPTPESIKINAKVRSNMGKVRDTIAELENECRQMAAKKMNEKQAAALKQKAEFVGLLQEHLKVVEELNNAHRADKTAEAHDELVSGGQQYVASRMSQASSLQGALAGGSGGRGGRSGMSTGMDSGMEGTAELDAGNDQAWQQLLQKDQEFEGVLDQISQGVTQLRDLAIGFREELKKQNVLLDEISKKIDKSSAGVEELNKKTEKALKMSNESRCCLYLVLIIILLAVVAFVLNKFVFNFV